MSSALAQAAYDALEQDLRGAISSADLERATRLLAILKAIKELPPSNSELTANEVNRLMHYGFIEAIKEVRSRTRLGLKEAKEMVERHIKDHGLERREAPNGTVTYEKAR